MPLTAVDMPQVSADGLTYTIKVKRVFTLQMIRSLAVKRELTAYDYAYSLKRLLDPKLNSPNSWLLDGRIKGLEAWTAMAKKWQSL